MKKIVALAGLFALAASVTLTSCSKKGDYTCTCTWNAGGQTVTQSVVLKDVKKKDAEKSCNVSYFAAGITGDCSID